MSRHKKRRVLVLVHEDLIPPDDADLETPEEIEPVKTEYDVVAGLEQLGHTVDVVGVNDDLAPLRTAIGEWKPDIVWNLLEEFRDEAVYDQNVVSYLELKGVPYTGNDPRGLIITRDKALSKKILHYHRIRTPRFAVFLRGRKVRRRRELEFPLFVKSLVEEASMGIAQASIVHNDEQLQDRVAFVHTSIGTDAIAEQFIAGRELYAPVLGNERVRVLPLWELFMTKAPPDMPRIATRKVKWDHEYQDKYGVEIGPAIDLPDELRTSIERTSRRIYRVLHMSGWGRIDFRLSHDNRLYFLEANPNADIAADEEFASAAAASGLAYPALLQRILDLGLRRTRRS